MPISILSNQKTEEVINWLFSEGRQKKSIPDLFNSFIGQVQKLDISILRSSILVLPLHPEVYAARYSWQPKDKDFHKVTTNYLLSKNIHDYETSYIEEMNFAYGGINQDDYKRSPYQKLDDGAPLVHCNIRAEQISFEFPILEDLKAIGATGYLAIPLENSFGPRSTIAWATNKEYGFNSEDIELLKSISTFFSLVLETHVNRYVTETLLKIYLGQETGKRVLKGIVQKGNIETIEAVIWYSDLRGFTTLAETTGSSILVGWLNEYFEIISESIEQYHGEILKFIGDAILAVFPVEKDDQRKDICKNVLKAAHEANDALAMLNTKRTKLRIPLLDHGIALHQGVVQYGNIGSLKRLDFTVIGQAVNLASRLEGLCGKTGTQVLVSEKFASYCDDELTLIGTFDLKGISNAQRVYTIITS